jgi:hypothetical protein
MLVGVGLNEARDRKAFAADETSRDASPDNTLEHAAENIAVAQTLVARTREHRVIRHLVLKAKPTEATIGEVELDLAAQHTFRADGKHVPDKSSWSSL